MRVFPTRLFGFDGIEADLERQTLSGGTSIAGEEDVIEADGGGRVYVQFTNPYLDEPEMALAWRANAAMLAGGATPVIVPIGDARHQLFGDVMTPPGGLPWWDESDFHLSAPDATVSADAALGATTLMIVIGTLNARVRPGIWCSVDHPVWRHRAYRVSEVAGDGVTLKITPPLREAVPSGAAIEFRDPKCTMRLDGKMTSPTTMGFAGADGARFVEFPGVPA